MYNPIKWVDHVVDQTGKVIQQGTDLSAANLNHMDEGIVNLEVAHNQLLVAYMHTKGIVEKEVVGEVIERTLTNTASFPFNNSQQSIALSLVRDTKAYVVHADVIEANGTVGDIIVYDKALNGFKIKYDGSAKSVKLQIKVLGGFMV